MRGYVELLTQKGIAAMVDCQNGGREERYDGKSVSFFYDNLSCHKRTKNGRGMQKFTKKSIE